MPPSLRSLLLKEDAQTVLGQLGIDRSAMFDNIAELARRVSGFDAVCISIMDQEVVTPIGVARVKLRPFRRVIKDRTQNEDFVYYPDFADRFPAAEIVNGTLLSVKSAGFFRLAIANETVGGLALYSFTPRDGLDEAKVTSLKKLAYVASELIRSKAELKLALGKVFALANQ